jgi:two-component system sensor histidine kinase GlrK
VGGKLSPEQREIVGIVRQNTLSLQKLIEDLLNYHQTRALEPQAAGSVSMFEVVRRVLSEHKLAALARMVTFEQQLEPALVVGDAVKLRTIVDNLVSNAIKYSPRSASIVVALGTERGFAVLDIVDGGPGIDRQERERIFDSFYQGAPPVDGRVKGSGLGLAIAREYALAYGGRIEVRDRAELVRGAPCGWGLPGAPHDTGTPARPDGSATAPVTLAGGR